MTEDKLQQKCYLWFHNKFPTLRGLLFHPANGGNRNAREGAKFKAMGVWPGVADLLFIYEGRIYALELKVGKGRQSEKQKKWETLVNSHNVDYHVIRDVESFKEIIKSIIKIEL